MLKKTSVILQEQSNKIDTLLEISPFIFSSLFYLS